MQVKICTFTWNWYGTN